MVIESRLSFCGARQSAIKARLQGSSEYLTRHPYQGSSEYLSWCQVKWDTLASHAMNRFNSVAEPPNFGNSSSLTVTEPFYEVVAVSVRDLAGHSLQIANQKLQVTRLTLMSFNDKLDLPLAP